MATMHIKKLAALKEEKKLLQEKEDKIKAEALTDLSTYLLDANALDIGFDILMGGMLYVIDKTNQGDKITEEWKLSGQKFCQQRTKRTSPKNPSSPKKIKKNKIIGE